MHLAYGNLVETLEAFGLGQAHSDKLGVHAFDICQHQQLFDRGVIAHVAFGSWIRVGALSRSSKLIHGGLRYPEVGPRSLVRESLVLRVILLKFAQLLASYARISAGNAPSITMTNPGVVTDMARPKLKLVPSPTRQPRVGSTATTSP